MTITIALFRMNCQAFQNGVELDSLAVLSEDSYDANSNTREIQPGASAEIQNAFILSDKTAPVKVEVSRLFGQEDEKVSATFEIAE